MTALLEVKNLTVSFPIYGGILKRKIKEITAVKNISFSINKNEAVGLVGESGSGKTTTAMACLGLVPYQGKIFWKGGLIHSSELPNSSTPELIGSTRKKIAKEMQIVFQDPYASLNPRMTVDDIISEGLITHSIGTKHEQKKRVKELLNIVGLSENSSEKYPHEFSGGQRQRIAIARALAVNPEFIFLDEAVSALDLLVQAQILNLLQELKEEMNLSYLFITHDLSIVEFISSRVIVMKDGEIIEEGSVEKIFNDPENDYTKKLLSAREKIS